MYLGTYSHTYDETFRYVKVPLPTSLKYWCGFGTGSNLWTLRVWYATWCSWTPLGQGALLPSDMSHINNVGTLIRFASLLGRHECRLCSSMCEMRLHFSRAFRFWIVAGRWRACAGGRWHRAHGSPVRVFEPASHASRQRYCLTQGQNRTEWNTLYYHDHWLQSSYMSVIIVVLVITESGVALGQAPVNNRSR